MTSKVPMPVSGDGRAKGEPDGVNESETRSAGGESSGGSYRNPHEGKDGAGGAGGFMGHGGQTEISYHGGGQAGGGETPNPNAPTEAGNAASGQGEAGPKPGPTGPDQDFSAEYPRHTEVNGHSIEIIDTSGTAAAEAAGKTGRDVEGSATEAPGAG